MLEGKIQSGRQHIGSMLRQLDSIFSAGTLFLARNPTAKICSLVYLVSLHLWVLYILFSHSKSTEDSTSSSVLSLANINGSTSVWYTVLPEYCNFLIVGWIGLYLYVVISLPINMIGTMNKISFFFHIKNSQISFGKF